MNDILTSFAVVVIIGVATWAGFAWTSLNMDNPDRWVSWAGVVVVCVVTALACWAVIRWSS